MFYIKDDEKFNTHYSLQRAHHSENYEKIRDIVHGVAEKSKLKGDFVVVLGRPKTMERPSEIERLEKYRFTVE